MLPAYGILGLGAERLVVRNGDHQPREVATAAGVVAVRAPGVNDKRTDVETGERKRFASAILPAWARKSPQVVEVLPLLYLHGLTMDASTITLRLAINRHASDSGHSRGFRSCDGNGAPSLKRAGSCATAWSQ